jgi:hypothetical protein
MTNAIHRVNKRHKERFITRTVLLMLLLLPILDHQRMSEAFVKDRALRIVGTWSL